MDFFNKLLHRNSSGGGGGGSQATSPKPLPVAKAGDSPLQSTSENKYFTLNDGSENKSPLKSQAKSPETPNENKENCHVQPASETKQTVECGQEETEEEKFEDAQENKLSLSLLAEDLNKVHLTTPGRVIPQVENHEFQDVKLLSESSSLLEASSSCLYESFVDSEVSFHVADASVPARDTSARSSSTPVRNISRFNVSDHNGQLLTPKRDDGSGNISVISEHSISFDEVSKRSSILSEEPEKRSSEESGSPNQKHAVDGSLQQKLEVQTDYGISEEKVESGEISQIIQDNSMISSLAVSNSVTSQDDEKAQLEQEEPLLSSSEVHGVTSIIFEEKANVAGAEIMMPSIEVHDATLNTSEEKEKSKVSEESQISTLTKVHDIKSSTSEEKKQSEVGEESQMITSIEVHDKSSNTSEGTSQVAELDYMIPSIEVHDVTLNTSEEKLQIAEEDQILPSVEDHNITSEDTGKSQLAEESQVIPSIEVDGKKSITEEDQMLPSIEVNDRPLITSEEKEKSQFVEEVQMMPSIEVNDLTSVTSEEKDKLQFAEEDQRISSVKDNDRKSITSTENEKSQVSEKGQILPSIELNDRTLNVSKDDESLMMNDVEQIEKLSMTERDSSLSSKEANELIACASNEFEEPQTNEGNAELPSLVVHDQSANASKCNNSQVDEKGSISNELLSNEMSNLTMSDSKQSEEQNTINGDLILTSSQASDLQMNLPQENDESIQDISLLSVEEVIDLTIDTPKPVKKGTCINEEVTVLSSNKDEDVVHELDNSFEIINTPTENKNDQVTNYENSTTNIETDKPPANEIDEDEMKLSTDSLEIPFVKRKENVGSKISSSDKPDTISSANSSTTSVAEFEEKLRLEFAKTCEMVDIVLNKEESVEPIQSYILQEVSKTLTEESLSSNKSIDFELSPADIDNSANQNPQRSDSNVSDALCPAIPAESLSEAELSMNSEHNLISQTTQSELLSPVGELVEEKDAEPQQLTNIEPVAESEVTNPELKLAEEKTEILPLAVTENSGVDDGDSNLILSQPQVLAELDQLKESVETNVLSNSLDKMVAEAEKSDLGLNEVNEANNETPTTQAPESTAREIQQSPEVQTSSVVEPLPTEIMESTALSTLESKTTGDITLVQDVSHVEQKAPTVINQVEILPMVGTPKDINKNEGSSESEQISVRNTDSSLPVPTCSEITLNESSFTQSLSISASESPSENSEVLFESDHDKTACDSKTNLPSASIMVSVDPNEILNVSNGNPKEQIQTEINPPSGSCSLQTEDLIPVSEEILDITNSEFLTDVPMQSIEAELAVVSPIKNVISNNERQKSSAKKTLKSPKPGKSTISKTSPKRNLMNEFKASQTKVSPKTGNSPFCEFFIPREEKTDDAPLEFDERLAEEAANISEHILNLSQEIMDSDSDDNNKTVIVNSRSSNVKKSPTPSDAASSPTKRPTKGPLQMDIGQRNSIDSLPIESYMQSMRSVVPAHLNQSEAGPITADQLSTQDLDFQDGASLDLDFFNQVGSSKNLDKTSLTLTRDSLYVKFDPIVGALVSKTVGDEFAMPPPPPLEEEVTTQEPQPEPQEQIEPNLSESKQVGQGDADKTPGRSPALEAVQKLISLTPPSASVNSVHQSRPMFENYYWNWCPYDRAAVAGTPTSTTPKSSPLSQEQLQRELKKLEALMKDREVSFESELGKKQAEIDKRETEMEAMMLRLAEKEAELKAASEQEHRLKKEVQEKTKARQQLSLVMQEYEQTISQLVAEKEQMKKSFEVQKDLIMNERDTAMQHLNNMEIAFNDVHQKYERSKTVIEGMKENENQLKTGLAEYDEAIKAQGARYDTLKNHAIKQLETANLELDQMRRSHKAEIDKMRAMLRKAEVQVKSLEEAMERKLKENQELTAICDELIGKVGSE